jgi:hypothetical protein
MEKQTSLLCNSRGEKGIVLIKRAMRKIDAETINLRPHHVLDIFKYLGNGGNLSESHSYRHSCHEIVQEILNNPTIKIELTCENDDICKSCKYLNANNTCSDVLTQFTPPIPKQIYNDELDKRLFVMLRIRIGYKTTAGKFLDKILLHMPEIIPLITHPGESEEYTEKALLNAEAAWNKKNINL